MTDIKELVTEIALVADGLHVDPKCRDVELCTRFLAAYLKEQEPVSLYPCGFKELKSLVIKHGAYLARGMNEDEPVTESIRSSAMVLVEYAKDMSDLLAKQPLFTAPPEPAPSEFSAEQRDKDWSAIKSTAPSSEEVGQLHPDMARSAAKSALGYAGSFNDKGIDWHNDKPWPHRMELAQALDWITELGAMVLNLASRVTPTAPSSEEVLEILVRLNAVGNTSLEYAAADLIERLAARVPDGCVVVQRKVTEDGKCVLATPGNYRTYQDQWNALIAAGEVK